VLKHPLAHSTHTVEMVQLTELHNALTAPDVPQFTAGELGMAGESMGSSPPLPPSAVLTELAWDGPPGYPYIYGRFSLKGAEGEWVDMHTQALRRLSQALNLRHNWGV
jgi:hypothetical protein